MATAPGELAERLVHGAADDLGAQDGAHLERPAHALDEGRANGCIGAHGVRIRQRDRDGGAREPAAVELGTEAAVVRRIALEERDLHPVEARLRELREEGRVRLVDVRGPQQQVHTDLQSDVLCRTMAQTVRPSL